MLILVSLLLNVIPANIKLFARLLNTYVIGADVFIECGQVCQRVNLLSFLIIKRGLYLVFLRLGHFSVSHISKSNSSTLNYVLPLCSKWIISFLRVLYFRLNQIINGLCLVVISLIFDSKSRMAVVPDGLRQCTLWIDRVTFILLLLRVLHQQIGGLGRRLLAIQRILIV